MSYRAMNKNKRDGVPPNDEWLTPPALVALQISMIPICSQFSYFNEQGELITPLWFDPFKNTGVYYDSYPTAVDKDYTEILEGRDFFAYDKKVDVICSNPPYSMWDKIYDKTISLEPKVVSFVMSTGNLTRCRMNKMKKAGYVLTKMHRFDVKHPSKEQKSRGYKSWMTSLIVQWEKGVCPNIKAEFTWDETPYPFVEKSVEYHREIKEWEEVRHNVNEMMSEAGYPIY